MSQIEAVRRRLVQVFGQSPDPDDEPVRFRFDVYRPGSCLRCGDPLEPGRSPRARFHRIRCVDD